MRLGFLFVAGALALGTACASGVEDDGQFEVLATTGAGGAGGNDVTSAASTTSAGSGGDGGMGGMAPLCNYDATNTCATGQQLQAIAGDENGPVITESGETSKWFVIHIEERVSNIIEEDLSYTVTLQSPNMMDWDLVVLQGPQDGNPDCNASPRNTVVSGNVETVHESWDDDQGLGGEDDSLWLCIEVRYVSGTECGSGAAWTLSVEGHT